MSDSISEYFAKLDRQLKRAKIREPGPGQYVDRCHWSKTGWGIWNDGGGCTCQPAKAPRATEDRKP